METEKEDFATWFARRKHLFKGDLRDFISSIATPHKKSLVLIGGKICQKTRKRH